MQASQDPLRGKTFCEGTIPRIRSQVDEDEKQLNEEEGQCFSNDQHPANEKHGEEKSSEEYQHAGIDKYRTTFNNDREVSCILHIHYLI